MTKSKVSSGDRVATVAAHETTAMTIPRQGLDPTALYPTLACNYRCVMCPNPLGLRHESEQLESAFAKAKNLDPNLRNVVISGGEPTLVGDQLFKLIDAVIARCPRAHVQVLSDGGRFRDAAFAKQMSKYSEVLHIEVPIHSSDESLSDAITGGRGSLGHATTAANNLLEAGITIDVRVVITRLNYETLASTVQYVTSSLPRIRSIIFIFLEATGECKLSIDELWVDHFQISPHLEDAVLACFRASLPARLYNFPLCLIPKWLWSLAYDSISPHKKHLPAVCSGCRMKERCPGIFVSNEELLSPYLFPITW